MHLEIKLISECGQRLGKIHLTKYSGILLADWFSMKMTGRKFFIFYARGNAGENLQKTWDIFDDDLFFKRGHMRFVWNKDCYPGWCKFCRSSGRIIIPFSNESATTLQQHSNSTATILQQPRNHSAINPQAFSNHFVRLPERYQDASVTHMPDPFYSWNHSVNRR